MRRSGPSAVVWAWLALAPVAAALADQAPWLSPEWAARRVVDVKAAATPGEGVAVAEFFSGGLAKPDGTDVRVAVRGRQPVGHRVLQAGPGDFFRVAFATSPQESRYYLYYGNPKAAAPDAWEPRRGVLLEVRRWPGGRADTLAQVQAAWAKAEAVGADFVGNVSFGFNPFGPSDMAAIYRYVGWFLPPKAGTYMMDLSSNGGAWLLVNGQEAVAWPGNHPPSGHARRAKPVAVTQTTQRLDFWNVNEAGTMLNLVAWQMPGTDPFVAIPPEVFLSVARATLVETDLPGERLVADFFADFASETWWSDRYAVRMRFRNLTKGVNPQQGGRFEWDFGDGQTSTLPSPAHVYLAEGDYDVSLRCSRAVDSHTFRTKVRVERSWWKQTQAAVDPPAKYAEEASRYDFARLDVRGLLAAVDLFEHENLSLSLAAAAAELVKRPGVEEVTLHRVGLLLGEHRRKAGQPDAALAACRDLEGRLKAPSRKADAAVQIGETLLRDLGRPDEAEKEYARVLKTYAAGGAEAALRRAHIGLGDIWRRRGDGEKARQAYAAATAIRVVAYAPHEAAVRVGTLARYVEEYTRERQWEWAFKFLDDWAWEFPQGKLDGHWSYLRAKALVAHDEAPASLQEAMDLLAANPASAYAVRLLMLAAECHVAAKQPDKARLLLQTAVEDYPEDAYQAEARKRLDVLGGPVKEPPRASPASPAVPAGGRG